MKILLNTLAYFIALGFGAGYFKYAPGTFGTCLAVLFHYFMRELPLLYYSIILSLAIIIGTWACAVAEEALETPDSPAIVWDEICGYGLTMLGSPPTKEWALIGFILFRFFDILKPWPVNIIHWKIKGGLGIILDDLAAAVYAGLILRLLQSAYLA